MSYKSIEGFSFEQTLHQLIKQSTIMSRKKAESLTEEFQISDIINKVYLDSEGKTQATSNGFNHSSNINSKDNQDALSANLVNRAINYIRGEIGRIDPLREKISQEHKPSFESILQLVRTGKIKIPPERHKLIAKALLAGFDGDWIMVGSILCFQLEAILRFILERKGITCTKFTRDQTAQEDLHLNELLFDCREAINDFFGFDVCFELCVLLVDRKGFNLRNNIAHGKLKDADFDKNTAIIRYWWIFLNLILREEDDS